MRYSRSDWTDRHPNWTALGIVSDVFIHHTASEGPTGTFNVGYMRQLESFEMNRGDGLIALAYHQVVFPNGDRAESRPWGSKGGATLNNNSSSVAVCLDGNFDNHPPTAWALTSAAEAIAEGIAEGAITPDYRLRGHRDVFATACPGADLYPRLDEIAAQVGGPTQGDDLDMDPAELEIHVAAAVNKALDMKEVQDKIRLLVIDAINKAKQ